MTGFASPKAASRRVASREGAGRALSKRVKVGECLFASLVFGSIVLWIRARYGVVSLKPCLGKFIRCIIESAVAIVESIGCFRLG